MQLHTLLPLIIYLGTATAAPFGGDDAGAGAGFASGEGSGLEAVRDAKIFGGPGIVMKGPILPKRGNAKSDEDGDCDDDDNAEDNEERALDDMPMGLMERGSSGGGGGSSSGGSKWAPVASIGTALGGIGAFGNFINGLIHKDKRDVDNYVLTEEDEDHLKTLYGRDLTLDERANWRSVASGIGSAGTILGGVAGIGGLINQLIHPDQGQNSKRDSVTELSPEVEDQLKSLLGRDLTLEERLVTGLLPLLGGGGQQQQQQQQPEQQQEGQQQNGKRDYQVTEMSPEVQDQLKTLLGRDLTLEERKFNWGKALGWGGLVTGLLPLLGGGGQQQQQQQQPEQQQEGQQQNGKRDFQTTELSPELQDQLQTLFGRDLGLEERKFNWRTGLQIAGGVAPFLPFIFGNHDGGGQQQQDGQQQNGKRDFAELSPEIEDQLKTLYGRDLSLEERKLGGILNILGPILGIGSDLMNSKRDYQATELSPEVEDQLNALYGRDLSLEERGKLGGIFNILGPILGIGSDLMNSKRGLQAEIPPEMEEQLKALFGRDLTVEERGFGGILGKLFPFLGLGGDMMNSKRDVSEELSPEMEEQLKTLFGRDLTVEERGLSGILKFLGPLSSIIGLTGDGNERRDLQAGLSPDMEDELKSLFGRDLTLEERGKFSTAANWIGGAGMVSGILGSILPMFQHKNDNQQQNAARGLDERGKFQDLKNIGSFGWHTYRAADQLFPDQVEEVKDKVKHLFSRDLLEEAALADLERLNLQKRFKLKPLVGGPGPIIPQWVWDPKYRNGMQGWGQQEHGKRGYEASTDWEEELAEQLRAGLSARGLNALA